MYETSTPPRRRYDWTPFTAYAIANPGEWVRNNDEDRSKIAAHDIRRGMVKAFRPAGAFDSLVRKDGVYIRYLGVPRYPWQPHLGDPRAFADLKRTFDPALFPPDLGRDWAVYDPEKLDTEVY